MALTSPDAIRSPNDNDQYALVQDLGVLADSTQTALVRRANMYIGTTAQRTAFTTAPEGVHWQDTNGTRLIYVRQSGAWVSLLGNSAGTVTNAVTADTGFSITDSTIVQSRGVASLQVNFTRTGSDISVGATGDIANLTVGTISNANLRPMTTTSVSSSNQGRVLTGYVSTFGNIVICAVGGTSNIVTGSAMSLGCTYLTV